MEKFDPRRVNITVITNGQVLYQHFEFPDGSTKIAPVRWKLCEEGDAVIDTLILRDNPVYIGTQYGFHCLVNQLLGSRGQHIDFGY